jgi:hypothetical protein
MQDTAPPDQPEEAILSRDLVSFASRIGQLVVAMEDALWSGNLAAALESWAIQSRRETHVLNHYSQLQKHGYRPASQFRPSWIRFALSSFSQALREPSQLWPALVEFGVSEFTGRRYIVAEKISISTESLGVILVRSDQLSQCRRWMQWFAFRNDEEDGAVTAKLVRGALGRLGSNLGSIRKMDRLDAAGRSSFVEMESNPDSRGHQLEQLVLDIINEEATRAHEAPFAEDMLERTDLRVNYKGLRRPSGARIQVTFLSEPGIHDQKVSAMRFREEFVVVSPLELARWVLSSYDLPCLETVDWVKFWEPFGKSFANAEDLGRIVERYLRWVLNQQCITPRGPVDALNSEFKKLVRAYVEHFAFLTTDVLRGREKIYGQFRGSA